MTSAYIHAIESDNSDERCLPFVELLLKNHINELTNDEIHLIRAVVQKWSQQDEKLVHGKYSDKLANFPVRQVEIAEITNRVASNEREMEELAPIAHENDWVKYSANFFVTQGLRGEALVDKIEALGAIGGLPSLNHVLGCLDEGFYKQHVVGTLQARITEARQELNTLQVTQDKAEIKLAKWAAVMGSIERVPHPIPNVTNSPPKRASSESAESETTKKARLDSAITLHSSSENSRPFSGTLTRPGSSKVSDYNIKANFHKMLDVHILDQPIEPSRSTKAGKAPSLRPAHNHDYSSQFDEVHASVL